MSSFFFFIKRHNIKSQWEYLTGARVHSLQISDACSCGFSGYLHWACMPTFGKTIWWAVFHQFLNCIIILKIKWSLEDKAWWTKQSRINSQHYVSPVNKSLRFCLRHTHKKKTTEIIKGHCTCIMLLGKAEALDSLLASVDKPCFQSLSTSLRILGRLKWMKCMGI